MIFTLVKIIYLNSLWLEMEKVIPFKSEKEFEKYTNITMDRLDRFLKSIKGINRNKENFDDLWDEDSFTYELASMVGDFGLPIGDITRYNHWGLNNKGELKILDFGLNDDIFKKYYERR